MVALLANTNSSFSNKKQESFAQITQSLFEKGTFCSGRYEFLLDRVKHLCSLKKDYITFSNEWAAKLLNCSLSQAERLFKRMRKNPDFHFPAVEKISKGKGRIRSKRLIGFLPVITRNSKSVFEPATMRGKEDLLNTKKTNTKVLDKESPKPPPPSKKKPDKPKKPSMKEKLRRTVTCLIDSKEYLKSKGLTVHCTGNTLEFEGIRRSWKEFKVIDMSQLSASDSNYAIRNHLWHFGIPDTAARMIVIDHKVPECDILTEKNRYEQSARAQAEKKGLSEKQILFNTKTEYAERMKESSEDYEPDFAKIIEDTIKRLEET